MRKFTIITVLTLFALAPILVASPAYAAYNDFTADADFTISGV